MEAIKDGTKNLDFLLDDLNNDNIANYYVAFTRSVFRIKKLNTAIFRLITSGFLKENAELYAGFIEGGQSLDQFCQEEIEPMWKECDHLSIIALVNAIGKCLYIRKSIFNFPLLDVPIRIEYMDQSQAPNGGWHHDFPEDREPQLFFLYRPGHYDILYKK